MVGASAHDTEVELACAADLESMFRAVRETIDNYTFAETISVARPLFLMLARPDVGKLQADSLAADLNEIPTLLALCRNQVQRYALETIEVRSRLQARYADAGARLHCSAARDASFERGRACATPAC